jgi:hypothetical protein
MTVAAANETKLLVEFQSDVVTQQTLKKRPWGAKNFVVKAEIITRTVRERRILAGYR